MWSPIHCPKSSGPAVQYLGLTTWLDSKIVKYMHTLPYLRKRVTVVERKEKTKTGWRPVDVPSPWVSVIYNQKMGGVGIITLKILRKQFISKFSDLADQCIMQYKKHIKQYRCVM